MTTDGEPTADDRLHTVYGGIEAGAKELVTLSDAQLLEFEGADRKRIVPLLSLDDQDTVPPLSPQKREQLADPFVRTVLALRAAWSGLLAVDQQSAESRDFFALYLRADKRAMTEYARRDGTHRFVALQPAEALDALVELLTPLAGVRDEDVEGRSYTLPEWQQAARGSDARIISTVIGVRSHRSEGDAETVDHARLTVFNYLDRNDVLLPQPDGSLTESSVSRATLRVHLMSLLESSKHPGI